MKKFSISLIAIISLFACVNFIRFKSFSENPIGSPIDFANVYIGQRLLCEHKDPYDDASIKIAWKSIQKEFGIITDLDPGFPQFPILYPPWGLAVFAPLGLFPYGVAYKIWYFLIPFLLIGGIYFLASFVKKDLPRKRLFPELVLLALAFKGTIQSSISGQPSFLYFALVCGFLCLYSRDLKVPAAISVGNLCRKIHPDSSVFPVSHR